MVEEIFFIVEDYYLSGGVIFKILWGLQDSVKEKIYLE